MDFWFAFKVSFSQNHSLFPILSAYMCVGRTEREREREWRVSEFYYSWRPGVRWGGGYMHMQKPWFAQLPGLGSYVCSVFTMCPQSTHSSHRYVPITGGCTSHSQGAVRSSTSSCQVNEKWVRLYCQCTADCSIYMPSADWSMEPLRWSQRSDESVSYRPFVCLYGQRECIWHTCKGLCSSVGGNVGSPQWKISQRWSDGKKKHLPYDLIWLMLWINHD